MARLGKAQRALRRQQWSQYRDIRETVIIENVQNPSKEPIVKYAALNDLGRFGARARVSQLIIKNDHKQSNKMITAKYRLNDADLYENRLNGEAYRPTDNGGAHQEPMVRVGTTKGHGLVIEQDGERKFIKVPAKAKFAPVGLPDSIPKDGGK